MYADQVCAHCEFLQEIMLVWDNNSSIACSDIGFTLLRALPDMYRSVNVKFGA